MAVLLGEQSRQEKLTQHPSTLKEWQAEVVMNHAMPSVIGKDIPLGK